MTIGTGIEWTDATWNPVRGCTKVSPGCKNCYAERFAERFRGVAGHPFEQGFDVRLIPAKLNEPLNWRTPKRIFVNSMSDLFHEEVPDVYVDQVLDTMLGAPWHTFQVLTKRADRMSAFLLDRAQLVEGAPHIWWGVSVEDRRHGVPRIEELRHTAAAVKFLSVEPLLESLGDLDLSGVDWVIVGGESGPRARAMRAEWVEEIFVQCRAANVPFFFKQWGGTRKKAAGRLLHGRTYDEFPILGR